MRAFIGDALTSLRRLCQMHALIGMLLLHSEDLSDACVHRNALTSLSQKTCQMHAFIGMLLLHSEDLSDACVGCNTLLSR